MGSLDVNWHFGYIENSLLSLDVIGYPVREHSNMHVWTDTLLAGFLGRQWDSSEWGCVLCEHCIYNEQISEGCACFLVFVFFFFSGKTSHHRVNFIRIKLLLPFDFQLSLHPTSSVVFLGPWKKITGNISYIRVAFNCTHTLDEAIDYGKMQQGSLW